MPSTSWTISMERLMILLLATLSALHLLAGCDQLVNVALNKPASQSSQWEGVKHYTPHQVVDGNKNTHIDFCTHTASHTQDPKGHWWQVDLQDVYEIHAVVLTYRGECPLCANRLKDFDITTSVLQPFSEAQTYTHVCHHYAGFIPLGATERLNCSQPIRGRYVRVIQPSTTNPLHICEVEVLAKFWLTEETFVRKVGQRSLADILSQELVRRAGTCVIKCGTWLGCTGVNVQRPLVQGSAERVCQLLGEGSLSQLSTTAIDENWDLYYLNVSD